MLFITSLILFTFISTSRAFHFFYCTTDTSIFYNRTIISGLTYRRFENNLDLYVYNNTYTNFKNTNPNAFSVMINFNNNHTLTDGTINYQIYNNTHTLFNTNLNMCRELSKEQFQECPIQPGYSYLLWDNDIPNLNLTGNITIKETWYAFDGITELFCHGFYHTFI